MIPHYDTHMMVVRSQSQVRFVAHTSGLVKSGLLRETSVRIQERANRVPLSRMCFPRNGCSPYASTVLSTRPDAFQWIGLVMSVCVDMLHTWSLQWFCKTWAKPIAMKIGWHEENLSKYRVWKISPESLTVRPVIWQMMFKPNLHRNARPFYFPMCDGSMERTDIFCTENYHV